MESPAGQASTSELRSYQPLVPVLVAAGAGILCDRYLPAPLHLWWLMAGGVLLLWLVLWRWKAAVGPNPPALLLLISVFAVGAAWHHAHWHLFPQDELGIFAEEESGPVALKATARGRPVTLPGTSYDPLGAVPETEQTRLPLTVTAVRDGATWRPASGRAVLTVQGVVPDVAAGDRLVVFGQFSKSMPAMNPGEFDFATLSRSDRQLVRLRTRHPECITATSAGPRASPRRVLNGLRAVGEKVLRDRLPAEQVALAAALLLGRREQLEFERTAAFLTTGTIHMLVVSGLHVGIFASSLLLVHRLGVLRRRAALLLVVGFVWLYALVAGGNPPVVRAAVLLTIVCMARAAGRDALGFNSWAAAALVVLILNPADLFRVGAQLSFLAVLVLMWLAKVQLQRRQQAETDPLAVFLPWPQKTALAVAGWYWQLTLASLVVWLVCLPLVMARFHLLSPAAVLLSPLLWPLLVVALLAGFALLIVSWLAPPLAAPSAWLCTSSLRVIEWSVQSAQQWRASHAWVSGPDNWWLVGFYGLLGVWAAFPRLRPRPRWALAMLAGWIACGFALPIYSATQRDTLHCTFVSVGHGCSVLVELPDRRTLLYDAGRLGPPHIPVRSISSCLWSRGIRHIDAVVLSHDDSDHYNALPGLLERFSVGVVYVSPMMFERDMAGLRALRQAIETAGVPLRETWQGDRLHPSGPAVIDVLHPPRTGVLGNSNANSVVLAIEYQGRRILLPGDLETPGLQDLLAEEPLPCEVVMAPHHGSRHSDPPGFAAWSTPKFLVMSGGNRRDLERTGWAYREVGAELFHTAQSGAVHVRIRNGEVTVTPFRKTW